jgi:hypothetical protein
MSGLLFGPPGCEERVEELADRLAGVGGELPALLGGTLVLDEGAVDAPMNLLDRCERIGHREHLGASLLDRGFDRGRVFAVDGGETVGMQS